MSVYSRISTFLLTVTAVTVGIGAAQAQVLSPLNFGYPHPSVGSWFGRAVQLCATGDATCPKVALYMTPTITGEGIFIGNDSLTLGGAPFGPHTTAHGKWISTSGTDIIVDYVFMLPGTDATSINALRFRWQASVTSPNTMQGYVNIFFGPPIPVAWEVIAPNTYPTLPAATVPTLTPPAKFYTDPATCAGGPPACPFIFKLTVQRITQ